MLVKVSGMTTRLPFGSRACAAIVVSSSSTSRTADMTGCTAKDVAATANGFRKYRTYGAVDGLYSSAHLVTRGAMSLTSSTHFPTIDPSIVMKPVALLPGRGKLATKPL